MPGPVDDEAMLGNATATFTSGGNRQADCCRYRLRRRVLLAGRGNSKGSPGNGSTTRGLPFFALLSAIFFGNSNGSPGKGSTTGGAVFLFFSAFLGAFFFFSAFLAADFFLPLEAGLFAFADFFAFLAFAFFAFFAMDAPSVMEFVRVRILDS